MSVIGYNNYPLLSTENILTLVTNVSFNACRSSCKVPATFV